jgi:hypothetical protein
MLPSALFFTVNDRVAQMTHDSNINPLAPFLSLGGVESISHLGD